MTTDAPAPDAGASGSETAVAARSRGALDKEIVRGIIRRHVPAVRACYEAVMGEAPYAQGRVVTRFTIDFEGKVRHSCLVSSTLRQPDGERCILDDELHWEFPKPLGGGQVVVDYPFVLEPETEPKDRAP